MILAVDLDYIDATPLSPREIVSGQFVAAVTQIEEDWLLPPDAGEDDEAFETFKFEEFEA